jgi:hypothetical protein
MAKLDNIRRLRPEDYTEKNRPLINKLAFILNPFMEQVVRVLNGNIDQENLSSTITEIEVTVDSNGTPILNNKFNIGLPSIFNGAFCINAVNLTTSTNYPTSAPFLSTTISNGLLVINNISGLQANEKYRLTIELK